MTAAPLLPGDQVPWFHAAALDGNPDYAFHSAAGRPILMLFAGQVSRDEITQALALIRSNRPLFDDSRASFFGVTVDASDAATGRIAQQLPGIRWFLDYDRAVSSTYGAVDGDTYRPHWLLIDRRMRVVARAGISAGTAIIEALTSLIRDEPEETPPPILVVPRVIEPEMCARLIALYEAGEPSESGFMREEHGKTVLRVDHDHKRRTDVEIADDDLQKALRARIQRFLVPEIQRSFQFTPTRIERYIVARYDAGAGWFRPHRDNTTKGTAHRRFACTINLNAGAYDGGDLRFPEFGQRAWCAPTGGAIVFSCSLLHEATPVTRGERYAFLPFFYDEAGAAIREANLGSVDLSN